MPADLNVVTGAYSFTGKSITRRLLDMGERVKTLTGHPGRPNPFGDQVEAAPFNFDRPAELAQSLAGASALYNTYWVRFPYQQVTFEQAIHNTLKLFEAANAAGVRRVIHFSITNPREDSPLGYFRGKAVVERALKASGLSYAIIRPTVIFGHEDILINNIAWFLRKLPVFAIPGSGKYHLQPVCVEDVADIAVKAGHHDVNAIIDAAGPEIYTYAGLVRLIAEAVGSTARIIHVPSSVALALIKVLNLFVEDVILTAEELDGLIAGLLVSDDPPIGKSRLSHWLVRNAGSIGRRYASEVARHYEQGPAPSMGRLD